MFQNKVTEETEKIVCGETALKYILRARTSRVFCRLVQMVFSAETWVLHGDFMLNLLGINLVWWWFSFSPYHIE